MPSFKLRGSGGTTVPTVWFGAVPDKLTLLLPNTFSLDMFSNSISNATIAATYANQWTPTNASFGGFITAPDGATNTMQLIKEDNTTNQHFITATTRNSGAINFGTWGRMRLSGFFKADGRTRIAFQVYTAAFSVVSSMTTTFDLSAGTIAIGPVVRNDGSFAAQTGNTLTSHGSTITNFGNGVYRCTLDFDVLFFANTAWQANVFLDAGSGSGAANTTYAGDGVSGVYAWRMNMMPVGSYAINNTVFSDDFTTLSTIDVNNTQLAINPATGQPYKWFVQISWNNANQFGGGGPIVVPASAFSISGSILTLGPTLNGAVGQEYQMATAVQTNAATGAFVGQGFSNAIPSLYEARMAYPNTTAPGILQSEIFWTISLDAYANQVSANPVNFAREMDMNEYSIIQGWPQSTARAWNSLFINNNGENTHNVGGNPAITGAPLWNAFDTYNAPLAIEFNGVRYSSTGVGGPNVNKQPDLNPTFWAVTPFPNVNSTGAGTCDITQQNVYTNLFLPYYGSSPDGPNAHDAVGVWLSWFNGVPAGNSGAFTARWMPSDPSGQGQVSPYLLRTDGHHSLTIIGGNNGVPSFIDYVKIMQ